MEKIFREPTEDELDRDCTFVVHIMCAIAEYAIKNNLEPDSTIRTVSENMIRFLDVATFNELRGKQENGQN